MNSALDLGWECLWQVRCWRLLNYITYVIVWEKGWVQCSGRNSPATALGSSPVLRRWMYSVFIVLGQSWSMAGRLELGHFYLTRSSFAFFVLELIFSLTRTLSLLFCTLESPVQSSLPFPYCSPSVRLAMKTEKPLASVLSAHPLPCRDIFLNTSTIFAPHLLRPDVTLD